MPAPTVAIIGLGFGRAHIPAFQSQGCRVVAVCQRDQASAKKIADAYGVPQVFARWQDVLERARPEIVVIATPPHLHHDIALGAVAAGAHVLCEKPVAMTRAEARAMVDAAGRAGRVAMTGFNWRFPAAMQRLHAMMQDGFVGRVLHVTGRWFGARWADEASAATWRMDRAQAGHGAMGDMGVHLVDLVRWTCGDIRRVVAHAGISYPRTVPGTGKTADAEDYAGVVAELASGAQATLAVSRAAHGRNDHVLEIYGTRGALAYRLTREHARWYAGELEAAAPGGAFQPVAVDAPAIEGGDQMDVLGKATIGPLVARMLQAIAGGAPPTPSLADGLGAQAVLDAVLDSVARRAWVEVSAA
ncbi:MAG TPA: Gfo/Idh/MocA family oxidoreductase [Methylomirabilota bacterium]|jgi:predicted dehydrogenase